MTNQKHFLVRFLALAMAVLLFAGMMPAKAQAANTTMFIRTEDLSTVNNPEALGFWRQHTVKRNWINTIEFHNSTVGAPTNFYDFSAAQDKSILGWYDNGVIHVASDKTIQLNTNSSWMFSYFPNLKAIHFNGCVDTTGVTNMEALFFCDTSLEELDVSFFNTSSVTNMNRMFGHCEKLKALDVSKFDTSNVNDFNFMFFTCRNLTELDVSGFNTSNAQYMSSMFYHCESLKTLDTSNFDYSRIINKLYMFDGCYNLDK